MEHHMATEKLSLEHAAYVEKAKANWRGVPLGMHIIEYYGDGDPAFGGLADDRPLGVNGQILDRAARIHARTPVAEYATIEAAHDAAKAISNRRPNSLLGVAPWWR